MPTSKAKGDLFELQVGEALELTGYRVSPEELVGHAKVDLLARRLHFGRERTIAVECKNEERPLTRRRVVSIWTDWEPLLDQGLVDEVLIVAANGLAPSALAYVNERRGLETQSLGELLASSITFDSYLTALQDEYTYAPDGLPGYYIPPKGIDGIDLDESIRRWILGAPNSTVPPTRPIAILGAYGLGKSSFATHLAASLARERVQDVSARVPILVRLHEIIGEQSLEGLLGKHFTATHDAPGYSFSKLMKLNRAGRLVIMFDGFDEMRQLLSWREFRHNLRELNRLCVVDARVIILGRPTAFETDAQQRMGLHGEVTAPGGSIRREPGWPDYYEMELAPLSESDCRTFLRRYLDAKASQPLEDGAFDRLWWSVNSRALRDIARRPVQLRMLAEILPKYSGDTEQLDLVKLYDLFIDELIDRVIGREEEKQSRLAFSGDERRLFLRRVAYWLWTSSTTDQVTTDALPDELVEPFLREGTDLEATRRDLVVGSALDRRAGERVRFPHRSFQEFLVAEELWFRMTERTAADTHATPRAQATAVVADADRAVSREVADFMGMLRSAEHENAARRLLVTYEGEMSARLVESLYFSPTIIEDVRRRVGDKASVAQIRPWELMVLALWTGRTKASASILGGLELYSSARQEPLDQLLALLCLLACREETPLAAQTAARIVGRIMAGSPQIERIASAERFGQAKRKSRAPASSAGSQDRHDRVRERERGKEVVHDGDPRSGWPSRKGVPHERGWEQTGGTLESRGIIPVASDFVLAGRDGPLGAARIGACTGRARLRKVYGDYELRGGPALQVRWLPAWGAEFIARLEFRQSGRIVHLDRVHPLFARALSSVAFTREWAETVALGARLDITSGFDISPQRPDWLADAMSAQAAIRKRWRSL